MSIALLADAAVKGVIYLVLLFAIAGALRRGPASVRHLFWSIGIVGLLALPVLSVVVPWRIEVAQAGRVLDATATTESVVAQPIFEAKPESLESQPPVVSPKSARGREGEAAPVVPAARGAGLQLPGLAALLTIVWIAGTLIVIGRLLVGMVAMSIIARRGDRLDGHGWNWLLGRTCVRLGIDAPVRLVASRHARVPFGCGVLRPTIVFPSDVEGWSEERRLAVLLHELAHYSRGDMIPHLLSQLACAVHWFNPLVWLGARRLRAESERACDDLVLRAGTPASRYAGHLIEIVRTAGRSWTPVAALPMARRSEFEGRLLAILEPGIRRHGLTPAAVLSVVLAVALTAIPLAAMGPERAAGVDTPQPPQDEARPVRVTALIGALDDADIDVRRTVAVSLGQLQDTTAVEALMRALSSDSDAEVREAAAYALGEIEDPRAIPALGQALLQDDVSAVRVMAAYALGEIEDARGVEPLAAAINDPDYEVRLAVIRALGEIESPAAIDALSSALGDSDVEIREAAVYALGEIEDSRAVPALANLLVSDGEASVRVKAAWALGEIEHGSAVDALATALSDQDVEVRRMAVWALGEIEDPRGVDPLIGVLRDPDVELRLAAIHALGQIESRRAVDPLIEALGDSDARVRERAAWALAEIEDPRAATGLTAALGDSDPAVRRMAVYALGELELATAPPALIQALRDEDPEVRGYAVHALGEIEDPAAVPGLAELFRNAETDADTRRQIVWALGEIEDPASYQVLVQALEDEDPEIRRAAARALGGND
jgi:HEAT repeat protein/beta-lactamase regulating signal transducer with metallopeptidase domain